MEKIINVGGRLHNPVVGGALTGADEIKDDLKGKMQSVINQETDAALVQIDEGKQDKLTFDQTPTENSTNPVTSGGVYAADAALQQAIEAILLLIPSAASALNQLADKAFVNSSIATATATFRGTYNLVTDLELTVSATHQQIATALASVISTADNNDYCFVQIPVSDQSTDIRVTERYKFDGTSWEYEYDLNNSGFTADQWGAINSGITSVLVSKLGGLPTAAELATMFNGKQNTLTFDTTPTAGSNNPVTSGGLYAKFATIDAMIPTGAGANNKLVAENRLVAYVTTLINALDATFDVTSADGHVTLRMTQTDGAITNVQVLTSDIASDAALTLLDGRVSTNEQDIADLQQLYNNLQQSAPQVIEPTDTWPVSNPSQTVIYRVVDRVNTPPQYYSDYMWNGTSFVLMAQYNNAIDDEPTAGSDNLVKSGGVNYSILSIKDAINLIDLNALVIGYFVNYVTGELEESSRYFATGIISIEGGKTYKVIEANHSDFYGFYAVYDSNMARIAGDRVESIADFEVTIPSDGRYIRLSFLSGERNKTLFYPHAVALYESDNYLTIFSPHKLYDIVDINSQLIDRNNVIEVESGNLTNGYWSGYNIEQGSGLKATVNPITVKPCDKYSTNVICRNVFFYNKYGEICNYVENVSEFTVPDGVYFCHFSVYSSVTSFEIKKENPDNIGIEDASNLAAGTVLSSGFLDGEGILVQHNSYLATDFIAVESNTLYYLTCVGGEVFNCCEYDKNRLFIKYSNTQSITTSSNTKYIRVSYNIVWYKYIQVTKNNIYPYTNGNIYDKNTVDENHIVSLNNPIVLPRKFYVDTNHENNIYFDNIIRYYDKNRFAFRTNRGKSLERRVVLPNNGNQTIRINKYDFSKDGEIVSDFGSLDIVSSSNVQKTVIFNPIGDSFTDTGQWYQYIHESNPNIKTVGMKYPNANMVAKDPDIMGEGRTGWTLELFMTVIHGDKEFSPFLHPSGYVYYGETGFWRAVKNGDDSYYNIAKYDKYLNMFAADGKKANPSQNDIMWDTDNSTYICYNGSSWEITSISDSSFVFDYAKYIQAWGLVSPDVVGIMLGTNDFYGWMNDNRLSTWSSRIDTIIDSIHNYDVNIKICILGGTLVGDYPNDIDGRNQPPQISHNCLFRGYKYILETFDTSTYEANNVYVVPACLSLDPEYGLVNSEIKPFELYTGNMREKASGNGIHPSTDGYNAIGVPVLACINYLFSI